MNAIVPASAAARAFLQGDLLRRIGSDAPIESISALAREFGRDQSNTHKTLQALAKDGLIDLAAAGEMTITEIGRRALIALDVAEGRSDVAGGVLQVLHAALRPNPLNPRTSFDGAGLRELADSIAGVDQVLVPLIVFPTSADGLHTLAAGERRWRAVQLLITDGAWSADRPLPCIEREEDPAQTKLIGLIENGQREDLNLYDQAMAYVDLMEATGWSARECARRTGKSARAVQEAVQVVRDAKSDDVEAFKQGEIKWEELRTGVRKPALSAPASVLADGELLDFERPFASGEKTYDEVRAAYYDTQADIEDFAPRAIELTPAQVLILLEVADLAREKPEKKAPNGPTAKLQRSPDLANPANLPTTKLVADGLIQVSSAHPQTVTLLPAGAVCLADQPGAFMDDAWKLRKAREAAGVSAEDLAELERTERYATDWLNGYQGEKRAPLAPADALIVLEIMDAREGQKHPSYYGPCVRGAIPTDQLDDLRRRNIVARQDGPGSDDGIRKVSATWEATHAVEQQYPKCDQVSRRREYMAALRVDLDLPAQKAGAYATDWLNGPFKPDPKWIEEKASAKAKQEREEEIRKEALAAQRARSEAFEAFEASIPTLTLDQIAEGVRDWLKRASASAPWRNVADDYHGRKCVSADSTRIDLTGHGDSISRRLAIMAVNIVAGGPPADWATAPVELDREAFLAAVDDLHVVLDDEHDPDDGEPVLKLIHGGRDA